MSRVPLITVCFLAVLLAGCSSGEKQGTAVSPPASAPEPEHADLVRTIQAEAVAAGRSPYFHWGGDPADFDGHTGHSNRLIPVYLLGAGGDADLERFTGSASVYRDAGELARLYGRVPDGTYNPAARYMDQTDIFRLQHAALEAGRRYIFLVVFDGMDRPTLELARVIRSVRDDADPKLAFQRFDPERRVQYGFMATSPFGQPPALDVDAQRIGAVTPTGGYDADRGGATPAEPGDPDYLTGRAGHAVTDSAASAVAMTTGVKTYNGSINISVDGGRLTTIAHLAQRRGMAAGSVTSVPFNHATAACAYAHNVSRGDYQDIARDMLGLPSVSHPDAPQPGMEVVIGAGFGLERPVDDQGANYEPGNRYIAESDLARIDATNGGAYRVASRTTEADGGELLAEAARDARDRGLRLFGLFGTRYGHLPFATADGGYDPAPGRGGRTETYTEADLRENPTLAEMTDAALTVLATNPEGFWLTVEQGDVDWASHANNVDAAAGAVFDGEAAVNRIIAWVETHSDWRESLLVITADHGHMLVWDDMPAFRERLAEGQGAGHE